jgi:hypothetical protein
MVCVELTDSTLTPRDERLGLNETVFRKLNEQLATLADQFSWGPEEQFDLICECNDATCVERIRLTRAEYEEVRTVNTHFVVFPGHGEPGIEHVVSSHETYDVVAKVGRAAQTARERAARIDGAPR